MRVDERIVPAEWFAPAVQRGVGCARSQAGQVGNTAGRWGLGQDGATRSQGWRDGPNTGGDEDANMED